MWAPGVRWHGFHKSGYIYIYIYNNFEFDERHFVQKLGTAIGNWMAPSYANIFMDKLEKRLISNALIKPHTWWRYIDDIL